MSKCIINGCDLIDEYSGRHVHGDLHLEGDCYVFNACPDGGNNTAWRYSPSDASKTITLSAAHNWFERRGVIVVSKDWAVLSEKAQAYLRGAP